MTNLWPFIHDVFIDDLTINSLMTHQPGNPKGRKACKCSKSHNLKTLCYVAILILTIFQAIVDALVTWMFSFVRCRFILNCHERRVIFCSAAQTNTAWVTEEEDEWVEGRERRQVREDQMFSYLQRKMCFKERDIMCGLDSLSSPHVQTLDYSYNPLLQLSVPSTVFSCSQHIFHFPLFIPS